MVKSFIPITIIVIVLLFSVSCTEKSEEKRYEAEFLKLFDTATRIIGYSKKEDEFNRDINLIYEDLKVYHELFDIYNNYDGINNIKTINDNAGIKPIKVDKKIIDMLTFSKEMYNYTGGKVNVAYGAVLKLWHDKREEGIDNPEKASLPEMDSLLYASSHTDIEKVIINQEENMVFLEDPLMSLDVGAIAKGYAVEQAATNAEKRGMKNFIISVGGNVKASGMRADGTFFKVGIQNPRDEEGQDISKVYLKDAALVTSGIYERFYVVGDKKYHHIINPETLMPADYFVSVSILSNDSGLSDALSTAIFNMNYNDGIKLIEEIENVEALWVFKDGAIKKSSGFDEMEQ